MHSLVITANVNVNVKNIILQAAP